MRFSSCAPLSGCLEVLHSPACKKTLFLAARRRCFRARYAPAPLRRLTGGRHFLATRQPRSISVLAGDEITGEDSCYDQEPHDQEGETVNGYGLSQRKHGVMYQPAHRPPRVREPSHESAERSSQGVVDVARVLLLHTNSTFSTHSHQNWEDHTWLKSQLTFECPAAFRSRSSRATR